MNELLYNMIQKRLEELEAEYNLYTGTTLIDVTLRYTNMEVRAELNKIQTEYILSTDSK